MDRCALAHQYHRQGYSCAQPVAGAFTDLTGLKPEQVFSNEGAFGGGVGGSHGELSAAISSPKQKQQNNTKKFCPVLSY